MEKLAQDLMEPNRQDALVMIDVDDFQTRNDCYGRRRRHGSRLYFQYYGASAAAIGDTLGRRGIPDYSDGSHKTGGAIKSVRRSEKRFRHFLFLQGNTTFYCTVTLGISLYDKEQSFKMNMTHADMALYRGKKTGKKPYCLSMVMRKESRSVRV